MNNLDPPHSPIIHLAWPALRGGWREGIHVPVLLPLTALESPWTIVQSCQGHLLQPPVHIRNSWPFLELGHFPSL